MRAALDAQAWCLRLDQTHTARSVDDDHALGQLKLCEPWLVVEADAYQQRRARAGQLRGLQFDSVRILLRRGEALDVDARAADRLGQ